MTPTRSKSLRLYIFSERAVTSPPPPTRKLQRLLPNKNKIYFDVSSRAAGGGGREGNRVIQAQLWRADAAQVCSNVGFVVVDGVFECSVAMTARQIVSERW